MSARPSHPSSSRTPRTPAFVRRGGPNRSLLALLGALPIVTAACASTPKDAGRWPARPEGCAVQVFPDAPDVAIENIGPVSATCGETIDDAECLRTLKDQVCKLGGDVVWGVADTPVQSVTKKKLAGRAAHTKAAR